MAIQWPWAILLCKYSDVAAEPRPPRYYEDLFTHDGAGGVCDYWRAVSFNNLDLTGSRVFGWLTMNQPSSAVSGLTFPWGRSTLVQWGRDAAAAAGIDLSPFRQVLVVQNYGVDHGAAGNGIVIVHQDSSLVEFGFICHEMGHGFDLPHSFAANPDFEYGDGWDLMSFATTTPLFTIGFQGASGAATVGLNARNLKALGAVPQGRTWSASGPDFSEQVTLDPLNQPAIGNHGHLVAEIPPGSTQPARPGGSSYTVEFRHRAGWDRAIAQDAVVVHEIRANGLSYLQPSAGASFVAGGQFVTPDPAVNVRVTAVTADPPTATVRIWDVPEGCLRKEDSKPHVYLVEGGRKRHVTSPQVLFALGRDWSDVRSVPDGGLDPLPLGTPVKMLTVAVLPYPVRANRPVTVEVTATDLSGNPLAGEVLIDEQPVAPTNTPFQYTFEVQRRRDPDSRLREWEIVQPVCVVQVPGFEDEVVDLGLAP